jgi:hypothetical protein
MQRYVVENHVGILHKIAEIYNTENAEIMWSKIMWVSSPKSQRNTNKMQRYVVDKSCGYPPQNHRDIQHQNAEIM